MKSVNQVTLLGNLTRDPELRYTSSGKAVINFSIATNRSWNDKDGNKQEIADYHNIVFWEKAAEIISQYCFKGSKILVQGRLQTRSWEDKNGIKKYTTEIIGKDFIFLTPKTKEAKAKEEAVETIIKDNIKELPKVTEDEVKVEDIPF